MNNYLIWINIGGDMEGWQLLNLDYKVCKGKNEEEAVRQWAETNERGLDWSEVKYSDGGWNWCGRKLTVLHLPEWFEDNNRHQLEWK